MNQDIRWKQRFSNFEKALIAFRDFIATGELNIREKQGLIKSFEYTYELAWKVMKDYLQEEGINDIIGSKSAIRNAFNQGLIADGEIWMKMYEDRNNTVHTYDIEEAEIIVKNIIEKYSDEFETFYIKFESLI